MSWYPDKLLQALLTWTVFTTSLPTLIGYRALLQPRYEWGLFGLVGTGMSAAYWLIAVAAVFGWTTQEFWHPCSREPGC